MSDQPVDKQSGDKGEKVQLPEAQMGRMTDEGDSRVLAQPANSDIQEQPSRKLQFSVDSRVITRRVVEVPGVHIDEGENATASAANASKKWKQPSHPTSKDTASLVDEAGRLIEFPGLPANKRENTPTPPANETEKPRHPRARIPKEDISLALRAVGFCPKTANTWNKKYWKQDLIKELEKRGVPREKIVSCSCLQMAKDLAADDKAILESGIPPPWMTGQPGNAAPTTTHVTAVNTFSQTSGTPQDATAPAVNNGARQGTQTPRNADGNEPSWRPRALNTWLSGRNKDLMEERYKTHGYPFLFDRGRTKMEMAQELAWLDYERSKQGEREQINRPDFARPSTLDEVDGNKMLAEAQDAYLRKDGDVRSELGLTMSDMEEQYEESNEG